MATPQELQPDGQEAEQRGDRQSEQTVGRSFSWGTALAVAAVVGLLAVVGLMLRRTQEGPVTVGTTAPDFTVETFDGETIRLSGLIGQVVVVNFWASWCEPCEQEAADLEQAYRMYKDDGVSFIGLNYVDTDPEALAYLAQFDISYPNAPDLGTSIAQAYRIRGVPETFIIGPDGHIAAFRFGPFESLSEIIGSIESARAQ